MPQIITNLWFDTEALEAVSLLVDCADQHEVDHYWEALSAGGDPAL